MKIAVSAAKPELASPVDPRFGRAPYFLFIDPETMKFEAVENPNVSAASGAGIQAAQLIAEKNAEILLTGSCGPNAFQTLQAAGVRVIVGVSGTVKESVERYKGGQFSAASQANVPSHHGLRQGKDDKNPAPDTGWPSGRGSGMGWGTGPGWGPGPGRGMGQGRGLGMGRGRGYWQGPSPSPPDLPATSPEEELKFLKQQAAVLRQQMEGVLKKIEQLETDKPGK